MSDGLFFLGGKKDRRDPRDRVKYAAAGAMDGLPEAAAVRHYGAVHDQGRMNSCVGHASAWMWEQVLKSRGMDCGRLSGGYVWRLARKLEGTQDVNEGVEIRSAMKVLAQYGAAPVEQFEDARGLLQDPDELTMAYGQALKVPKYARCETLDAIRYSIAREDQSVVIGLPVTRQWYGQAARLTGQVRWNAADEVLGYHAMVAVGYDDKRKTLTLMNSWGEAYGWRGRNMVDYAYLENEMWDAWTVDHEAVRDGE